MQKGVGAWRRAPDIQMAKSNWTAMKWVTCKICSSEFYTSGNQTTCQPCKKESEPTTYGLRFFRGAAQPTDAFWRAWRADRDYVKKQGFYPDKNGAGKWIVKRMETGEKQRVKSAIERRYSRSNKFGM